MRYWFLAEYAVLLVNNDAMFVKRNDNLYLSLPNEMSDSDGICNKDAVCVKK